MVNPKIQIILMILFRDALMIDSNDTSSKTYRRERVNDHIVKLSSDKPITILCHKEGFLGDQNDCSVFYRCMKTNDKYTVFRFQCAPGTVFDTVKEICNYPQKTQRSECRIPNQEQKYDNEITNIHSELPKPIIHIDQDMDSHKPLAVYNELSEDYQEPSVSYQQAYPVTQSTTIVSQTTDLFTRRPPYLTNHTEDFQGENRCTKDGFMGDTLNCKKFYRCVDNLRGGFIRYEFLCNDATIWDESTQSCNHAWIARNLRCGRDSSYYNDINDTINMGYGNKNNNNSNVYPIKQNIENSLEINYNQSNTLQAQTSTEKYNDIKIDTDTTTLAEKPHSIKPILSTVPTQFGDKILGYGDSESMIPTEDKKNQIHNTIQDITEFNPPSDSNYRRNMCVQNGFFGYSGDCKKFYRCVESSRGKYTRYDFSCSDGTVWDDNLKACNFAWAVKECGSYAPLKDLTSTTSAYSNPSSLYTSSFPTPFSKENVGYTTHSQTNDDITSKPSTLSEFEFSVTYDANRNECDSNGFYGDQSNCQNFYRCIETRRGVFTKLSYKCGEGTLWDPSIEACNHAWAVKNCTISMSSSTTTTNSPVITTISLLQTTTQANEVMEQDYDAGYNQGSNQFILSTPKDLVVNIDGSNKCTNSGFMGNTKDCKKFYRCVDNGNGKFTQYEFSCGEGTVWDPKIESCNHAWAVEKCGGTISLHYSNETVLPMKPTTHTDDTFYVSEGNFDSSKTTALGNVSSKSTISLSNVDTSSTTHSSFSERPETSSSSFDLQEVCEFEGFYPDRRDCKKFYRCIDDGTGKHIKHEFTCGEGTAWDVSINSCNHMSYVKSCQGMNNEVHEENTPNETTSQTEIDTTKPSTTSRKPVTTENILINPIKCKEEGYFGNVTDCTKFYRCVDNGKTGFEMYEYSCGEGTIWDQDIVACNYPQDVERPSCSTGHNVSTTVTVTEVSQTAPTSDDQSLKPTISSTTPVIYFSTTTTSTSFILQSMSNDCDEEGYFGDFNDCKIFYRCVNDGKGQYIKYEFSCGEGTIWDQDILACNHPQDVKKFTCSENNGHNSSTTKKDTPTISELPTSKVTSNTTPFLTTATIHSTTVRSTEFYDKESSTTLKSIEQTTVSSSSINMKPVNQNTCFEEGYFGDTKDCKKFYRCVYNSENEFIKYDFACGEGTIWDQDILACNHPRDVKQTICLENNNYTTTTKRDISSSSEHPTSKVTSNSSPFPSTTIVDSTTVRSTELYDKGTSTTLKPINQTTASTTSNIKPINQNTCQEEGYFGDTKDCKKFYRCVDNGKNEFTKYDFTCGEGTIWDQDIIACNHPQDVQHPSCSSNVSSVQSTTTEKQSHQTSSSTQTSSPSTSSTTTQYINTSPTLETSISPSKSTPLTSSTSTTTKESSSTENNENQNSTDQQQEGNFACTEAGFYPNPNDCKKFYRCVDWNNDGSRFTIFHFECGEGTIWDPSLDTCNYENAIYPPRDCSASHTQNNTETPGSSSTDTTTAQATTTLTSSKPSTTKSTTEKSSSTSTTEQSSSTSTTEQNTSTSTTEQSSTTLTTEKSTSTSTTEQSTSASTTDDNSSTETTQQQISTTEKTTTQTEASSTDQSTATTSPESSSTERSTTPMDQTTQTNKATEEPSTSEGTTQASSTEQQSTLTTASSTESTEGDKTTTEGTQQTTETTTSSTPKDKCPEMEDDQYAYVCPTSFRQHPKYCNLFYQCTEDDDNHDLKIALFHCPNNTIYDETKTQCVDANKASKKCDGSLAQTHRIKRFSNDYIEPIIVGTESYSCPSVGYFPFEKNQECSQAMLKCQRSKNNKLIGYVFKCPEEYTFWSKSKRCEKLTRIRDCKRSIYPWDKRYEIPKEIRNVALH